MRDYIKPLIEDEEIEIEDIMTSSGVKDIMDSDDKNPFGDTLID